MQTQQEDVDKEVLLSHGYEYVRYLGKGSFSSVILCTSRKYNQEFAIKRAVKNKLTAEEYNTLTHLIHPNVIRLYDFFEDNSVQYLVMEYCSNGTIKQKPRLPYDKFVCYSKQILEGLCYCHSQNIAHRDIKPENIFIDDYDHVKIADFGLSRHFDFDVKTKEKCGSLMFLAPEMLSNQEIDPFKADVWALGITFFYMATGSYPFKGNNQEDLKKLIAFGDLDFSSYEVDQRIRFLINKMTTINVKLRPTVDKLLKFPMFNFSQQNTKNLMLSEKMRKQSLSFGFRTPFKLPPDQQMKQKNTNSEDDADFHLLSLSYINSYKDLCLYPKIQRSNCRIPAPKTFL